MTIKKRNGITLTELLVASILIGIVMIGVASFSVSISKLQGSTNRATVLAMKTTAAMSRMTKDAYLAVGEEADRGVIAGNGGTGSVCFRHDTNNDPYDDYAGDTWVCYYAHANRILYLCESGAVPPVDNWADCNGADEVALLDLENTNIVDVFEPQGTGLFEYVEINIPAIFSRAGAYHPIDNPRYTLTSQINPPGHSK